MAIVNGWFSEAEVPISKSKPKLLACNGHEMINISNDVDVSDVFVNVCFFLRARQLERVCIPMIALSSLSTMPTWCYSLLLAYSDIVARSAPELGGKRGIVLHVG